MQHVLASGPGHSPQVPHLGLVSGGDDGGRKGGRVLPKLTKSK
jgi:hypothetical protein